MSNKQSLRFEKYIHIIFHYFKYSLQLFKVRNRTKIRNRHNQAPHLTQDTNGKMTTSQLDITNESQEVNPFPVGDNKPTTVSGSGIFSTYKFYIVFDRKIFAIL